MKNKTASADALARACADAMYARDRAAQELDITLKDVKEGYAVVKMRVRDEMLNGHGICHGGFIFTLADTAFAYACNSRNQVNVAQSCDIDFVAPADAGADLVAVAKQQGEAGRTGLYDVTVTGKSGEVIAHFRGRSCQLRRTILDDWGELPNNDT